MQDTGTLYPARIRTRTQEFRDTSQVMGVSTLLAGTRITVLLRLPMCSQVSSLYKPRTITHGTKKTMASGRTMRRARLTRMVRRLGV
jgi:hypothetical protein